MNIWYINDQPIYGVSVNFHNCKPMTTIYNAVDIYTSSSFSPLQLTAFHLRKAIGTSAFHIGNTHDDVIKWKHFPRYWPFVRGIHGSPVNSPHKGQWRGALKFSLIRARINGWVNNREAGDLRRHQAHCDVIVMLSLSNLQCYINELNFHTYQSTYRYWQSIYAPMNGIGR